MKKHHHQERVLPKKPLRGKLEENWRKTGGKLGKFVKFHKEALSRHKYFINLLYYCEDDFVFIDASVMLDVVDVIVAVVVGVVVVLVDVVVVVVVGFGSYKIGFTIKKMTFTF